jgi:curli biogenesis system outer membrane secretion channel CsgG
LLFSRSIHAPTKTIFIAIGLASLLMMPSASWSEDGISDNTPEVKRKVAVARFTNETQSGNTFLVSSEGDRLGKQASDILSSRLAETNKFLLFERLDSEKTSAEQMLAGLSDEGVSVDYIILGSVSEFGRSTESDSGVFSRTKTQKAYAKVNVRLVEVETGRIVFAAEGAGEATSSAKKTMGVGSSAGFDQSLTDMSISSAISQVTSNLVENMTSKPWRSYVLASEDGFFIIAGGEGQGLLQGMQLSVYEQGKEIKNPQTGAMISLPGKEVAKLELLYSYGDDEFSQISFTQIVTGDISEPFEKYYVSMESEQ